MARRLLCGLGAALVLYIGSAQAVVVLSSGAAAFLQDRPTWIVIGQSSDCEEGVTRARRLARRRTGTEVPILQVMMLDNVGVEENQIIAHLRRKVLAWVLVAHGISRTPALATYQGLGIRSKLTDLNEVPPWATQ